MFLVALLALLVSWMIWQHRPYSEDDYGGITDYRYGRMITDQAIKERDEKLCERIKETTKPGPADGPMIVKGQEAINWCKEQVKVGHRIIGG